MQFRFRSHSPENGSLVFCLQVAGMAVLGFSIWMRMDPKVNHYVRASYDEDDMNTYYIICYLLMGAGGVMTFVGFLGCCGAFQESRCMLGTVSTCSSVDDSKVRTCPSRRGHMFHPPVDPEGPKITPTPPPILHQMCFAFHTVSGVEGLPPPGPPQ